MLKSLTVPVSSMLTGTDGGGGKIGLNYVDALIVRFADLVSTQ